MMQPSPPPEAEPATAAEAEPAGAAVPAAAPPAAAAASNDNDTDEEGSDMATVSDVHTVTGQVDELAFLSRQQRRSNIDGDDMDTDEDTQFTDNDVVTVEGTQTKSSTELFGRPLAPAIGQDYTHDYNDNRGTNGHQPQLDATLLAANGGAAFSPEAQKEAMMNHADSDVQSLTAAPPVQTKGRSSNPTHPVVAGAGATTLASSSLSSGGVGAFWNRVRRAEQQQQIPAVQTAPTNESEQQQHVHAVFRRNHDAPPKMITVGGGGAAVAAANGSGGDGAANNNKTPVGVLEDEDDDEPKNVWKQPIFGVRADRLIIILLMILIMAIAVIVVALIISSGSDTSTSSGGSDENLSRGGLDGQDVLTLTRTPVSFDPPVPSPNTAAPTNLRATPTMAPTTFSPAPTVSPVPSASPSDGTPEPTRAPIVGTSAPATAAPSTLAPVTPDPTLAPTLEPWDTNACGTDNTSVGEFPEDTGGGEGSNTMMIDCTWLSRRSRQQERLCVEGRLAYLFCRETCRNCGPDTGWPVDQCGADDSTGTFFAGNGFGTQDCAWLADVATADQRDQVCSFQGEAYELCRETCRNCNLRTNAPTRAPTTAPTRALTPAPMVASTVASTTAPTTAPTLADAPTATPTEKPELTVVLLNASPDSQGRLAQPNSPQARARDSLETALNDGYYANASLERWVQLWSLLTFRESTRGWDWNRNSGWYIQGDNECTWEGVSCDDEGRVVALGLENNNLQGRFPPELSLLGSSLFILDVTDNQMGGEIPESFGDFVELEIFHMDRNNFEGVLPESLGNMRSLRIWYLERNRKLSGFFPNSVASMENLVELVFYYTSITFITDGVCQLPALEALILDCRQVDNDCWTRCFYLCGGNTGVPCNSN